MESCLLACIEENHRMNCCPKAFKANYFSRADRIDREYQKKH